MFCEPSKSHNNTVQIGGWPWGALAPLASEFAGLARDAPSAARGDHLKRVALFYQRPASESGIRLFLDFASRSRSHEAAVSARCASGSKPEWLLAFAVSSATSFRVSLRPRGVISVHGALLCTQVFKRRCLPGGPLGAAPFPDKSRIATSRAGVTASRRGVPSL